MGGLGRLLANGGDLVVELAEQLDDAWVLDAALGAELGEQVDGVGVGVGNTVGR